jgi:RNA polymerase sigma-70 factor, ECF subfamily
MRLRAVAESGGERGTNAAIAAAYADYAPFVRARLAELGVRDADLADLCHEVFLIVHQRADALPEVARVDLWLRAVCRRVAAGYRRRAGHRNELLGHNPDRDPAVGYDDGGDAPRYDQGQRLALVRRALNHLDEESRDLLALADVGQMPIATLAKLVDHDRKTVRKRLDEARRRITRLVRGDYTEPRIPASAASRITPIASPLLAAHAARGRKAGCAARELEVVVVSPCRRVGLIGNVAIADWTGEIRADVVGNVLEVAPRTVERCGGELAYLALIEPEMKPPSLEARQRIVEALEIVGPYVSAFALVSLGEAAAIGAPIVSGMMLLARPRFAFRAFSAIAPAAAWLSDSCARGPDGPLAASQIVDAAERLRAVR